LALTNIDFKRHRYDISYDIVNPDKEIDIVFLHGWGSNKELMKQCFQSELRAFRHIYIDLPGFGNSTASDVLTSDDYATLLEQVFAKLNISRDIIVGHSFGGKVATLLEPQMLVLIASAGILVPKSLKTKSKILLFKLLKIFGLTRFRKFFVADDAKELNTFMYETFKNVIAEDFTQYFEAFEGKALLFWGKDDTATLLYTAQKIESLMDDAKLYTFKGDHYFFMQHAHEIAQTIENQYIKESQ